MNKSEAQKRFNSLPEHMKTKKWIESEIAHEEHKGVHTYHACSCGRGCRSSMCACCWREVLEVYNAQ